MSPATTIARERRVLVAGAIGVLLLLAVGRGLPSLCGWQVESRESAAALTQELARARASVTRARATRDSLAARRQRFIALAPLLVRGETPAMGGATLAALIATAATATNVRLGPVQVRADTAGRGVFSRVGVRADVTGDVRGVGAFLSTLEGGPTLLAVRELTISQLEPAAPPERAEALHVQLAVEGLMLTPRPVGATKAARRSAPGRRTP
jgi:hypothetical protein